MFLIENGRTSFYQWDVGQRLIVNHAEVTEVHFAHPVASEALRREVYEEDGQRLVDVPDIVLTQPRALMVYGCCEECVRAEAVFRVIAREKPTDYVYTEDERREYDELRARVEGLESTVGSARTLVPSDFTQGSYILGTGVIASDYGIMSDLVPVAKGQRIAIDPNGFKVTARVLNSADYLTAITLKGLANLTAYTEYVSEYDAYLSIVVNDSAGQKIAPADYACVIKVGQTAFDLMGERIDKLESDRPEIAASPRHKPYTRIVNDCQDVTAWRITNTSSDVVSVDTTDYILGSQSIRCDKQMQSVKHTYDLINNDMVLKLRINSISQGASLQLRIGHKSGGALLSYEIMRGTAWTTPTDWYEVVVPRTGYTYGNTELDFGAIDNIFVLVAQGTADWNLQYVGLRPRVLNKGIVSFTFDDGYKSQYTGIKILAEKGITGTIYHIKEATDTGSDAVLSVEDLQNLVNHYGADIEVHGDPSYDQWAETDLKEHWEASQKWLKENGLGDGKHMAYPNGMYPDRVVQMARAYFDSCRTITPFIPVESYPPADRYRIRAVSGIGGNGATVDTVKSHIDKAVEGGAWLILVFHKIGDGTDSMWCSEADLRAIADYAIASGAHLMNVAEVFDGAGVR